MTGTTIAQFQRAAQAHLHAAGAAAGRQPPAGRARKGRKPRGLSVPPPAKVPAGLPATIAYLSNVAAECALKSLILKGATVTKTEEFQLAQPKIHKALFQGKAGHDLGELARAAQLMRRLDRDAPEPANPVWKRMCLDARPYSLRYGIEDVTAKGADEEHALARKLHEDIRSLLGRIQR